MSNDDILQVQDLKYGKLNVDTIAEVAMVGTTADTTTNREGVVIDTLEGRLKKVGFEPPLPYAAGITFADAQDAVKSFDRDGIVYGCLASSRPFTTTGNFQNDSANFFVIQDISEIGDVRTNQDNTYDPGTTQSFDDAQAGTFRVAGVDVTTKNNSQDSAISSASSAASAAQSTATTANNTANTANNTANTALSKANQNESDIANIPTFSATSASVGAFPIRNAAGSQTSTATLYTTKVITGSIMEVTGFINTPADNYARLDINMSSVFSQSFISNDYSVQVSAGHVNGANNADSFGTERDSNQRTASAFKVQVANNDQDFNISSISFCAKGTI